MGSLYIFNYYSRIGVARTLIEMRASFAIPKDLLKSPERPTFNSVAAQVGMKKLNDHLEMFEENHMQVIEKIQDNDPCA